MLLAARGKPMAARSIFSCLFWFSVLWYNEFYGAKEHHL